MIFTKDGQYQLDADEIFVGQEFQRLNPRFDATPENVALLVTVFQVVKRHRQEAEWSVPMLESLFLDMLAQGRMQAKPKDASAPKATTPAPASPAPAKVLLRTADALHVARENARRAEADRIARENSEEAKTERRALSKRLAEKLIDSWGAEQFRVRMDQELERALNGEHDGHFNINAAKYKTEVAVSEPYYVREAREAQRRKDVREANDPMRGILRGNLNSERKI